MRWFDQPRPWLLLGSLAANLFFVGLIAATVIFAPPHGGGPPPLRFLMHKAGPEAQPVIEQAMEAREPEMRAAAKTYRDAKEAVRGLMTADRVDQAALRQALGAQREARARLSVLMDDAYAEILPKLSPETRREMAERRWKSRRDRDDKKSD